MDNDLTNTLGITITPLIESLHSDQKISSHSVRNLINIW